MSDNVATAEQHKAKGNEFLKSKDFDKAIEEYTKAIELNKSHVYFSNRSAAYLSKGDGQEALKDANSCVEIKPDWAKGYSRQGAALHKLGKYTESIKAYEKGLELDPNNQALLDGLSAVSAEATGAAPGEDPMAGISKMFANVTQVAQAHPKLREYMSDPSYVQMLQALQTDPSAANLYMSDPRFMETLSVVIGMDPKMSAQAREAQAKAEEEEKELKKKRDAERKIREEEERKKREEEEFKALPQEEKDKVLKKKKAQEVKKEGNELYKKKQFKEAIERYDEALELDPTEISVMTNKAAVLLEINDEKALDNCVECCKKAIEVGRENFADYALIAKAFARMGNAYMRHKKYEEAIESYKSSLLESKSPDVANKLRKAENLKKKQDEVSYVDPEKAVEAKQLGNEALQSGKFPEAIKHYTEAVKRDPSGEQSHIYFSNRAAAYMKLADFGRAMDDVKKAIELNPNYVKAWSRKGNIEVFLKEYHKALDSFKRGLEVDPNNQACKDGLQRTQYQIQMANAAQSGETDADRQARAQRSMEDPEIRNIMSDPVMRQVLQDMSSNPAAASKHMTNPEVAGKIQKLIAAGILQTR